MINITPIAQTFTIPQSLTNGCFITSIDLFFAYVSPSESNAVTVSINKTVNGYPSGASIATSVLQPSQITASSDSTISTKFSFKNLVKLNPNTEYCIVISSNSLTYKVWTATMGNKNIKNPAVIISQQPAVGSLFLSQNGSTWTAEQNQDLTFNLNRASFSTAPASITLVEPPFNNFTNLFPNPFHTTVGKNLVRVHHENHGLSAGMQVVYSGSIDTYFNSTFTVNNVVTTDSYFITINTGVYTPISDNVGGSAVKCECNQVYSSILVSGIHSDLNASISGTLKVSNASSVENTVYNILPDNILELPSPKYVMSSTNRTNILSGANSFNMSLKLSTTDSAISPIIDLSAVSCNIFSNKINRPSISDINFDTDGIVIQTATALAPIGFSGNTITLPPTTDYSKIVIGTWVKITTDSSGNINQQGFIGSVNTASNTLLIVGAAFTTTSSFDAVITQYNTYSDETENNGTAESKHITLPVTLNTTNTGFRIMVDVNTPVGTDIAVYYRNTTQSYWTSYPVSYTNSVSNTDFTPYEWDLKGLSPFTSFQFKFVFLSDNLAFSPKIKNLRIISHA